MRVLFTGDWHGDWMTTGVDRFEEVSAAAHQTVVHAIDRYVDLYVFLGDLADPDNPRSHRAVALGIELMRILADNQVEQLWIAGNHDVLEDGTGATTLSPLRAAQQSCPGARVLEQPGMYTFGRRQELAVLSFPYVARSRSYDPAHWAREWTRTPPSLIVGHLMLPEALPGSPAVSVGTETTEMPRGRDLAWPIAEIRKRWPTVPVVGGHYHNAQFTSSIHFPGNLARLTHGEELNQPGFLVMEIP